MQPKVFGYLGFVVKVMALELPSNTVATVAPLKYVASIAIILPGEGRLTDHTRWIHPIDMCTTPEQIFEFGTEYAIRIINEELFGSAAKESIFENSSEKKSFVTDSQDTTEYSV